MSSALVRESTLMALDPTSLPGHALCTRQSDAHASCSVPSVHLVCKDVICVSLFVSYDQMKRREELKQKSLRQI